MTKQRWAWEIIAHVSFGVFMFVAIRYYPDSAPSGWVWGVLVCAILLDDARRWRRVRHPRPPRPIPFDPQVYKR